MTVDNILALKAANATTEVVNVLGYYTKNDGGGGEFYLDPTSSENDNGGTIIEPDTIGGRWKRLIKDDIINVKFFGAIGDGVTDDYNAIVNARDFASPNLTAPDFTLLFPSNHIFFINQTLDLSAKSGHAVTQLLIEGKIKGNLGDELIIGNRSSQTIPVCININDVELLAVRAQGLKNGSISIKRCSHLIIWADGDDAVIGSTAYNHFYLGTCNILEIKSKISATSSGWINENFFHGGRIGKFKMEGNYGHNHNIFFSPTFENCEITIDRGSFNSFYNCRLEGTNNISFGSETTENVLHRNWYSFAGAVLRGSLNTSYTDNGYNNQIVNDLDTVSSIENLYSIDTESKNYNIDNVTKTHNELNFISGKNIWVSGLIAVDVPFGIIFNADAALFRMTVTFYDVAGNQIISSTPPGDNRLISSTFLTWNTTLNSYTTGTNRDNLSVAIGVSGTTAIRFVSFRIYTATSGAITNASIKIKKRKQHDLHIPVISEHKNLTGSSAPSTGDWAKGTIISCSNPDVTGYTGWICLNGGSPGNWVPFGQVNEDSGKSTSGITTSRPIVTSLGFQYFDVTLGYMIWWNGIDWVDSKGLIV